MFYKKKGYPEIREIVVCTIQTINPHSAFANLDEYEEKRGMIHISEIAYGRIRNIKDHIKKGKTVICKVTRIDKKKEHIDLSLKRVKNFEEKNKWNEWKRNHRVESLMRVGASRLKKDLVWMYKNFGKVVIEEYDSLSNFIDYYTEDPSLLKKLKTDKKAMEVMEEILKDLLKKKVFEIKKDLKVSSLRKGGVQKIKKVLKNLKKEISEKDIEVEIGYLSAPRYSLKITGKNFKKIDKKLRESLQKIEKQAKKEKVEVNIEK